jgi:glyoxylase-like metal-dependent hydrolase (beta-lactamase superfamily II)
MRGTCWASLWVGAFMTVAMGGSPLFAQQSSPTRVISKIRGDLYKFQNDGHNSWFLVTPEGVIVGDPINPEAATWLKGEIAQRFNVPVKYLVYSHHHWDHARGARVFDDTAELVGHANMAEAIKDAIANLQAGVTRGLDKDKNGKIEKAEAQGGTAQSFGELDTNKDGALDGSEITGDVRLPETTYTDRRTITLGGKRVELIHPGPNHSVDGTIVYFPAERVVFGVDWINVRAPAGNLLTPAPPSQWVKSLKLVAALDFDLVAPGHGNIGTKADMVDQAQYYEDLVAGVSKGIAAGQTVEQLQASNLLEKYSWWPNFTQGRNQNIAHVYQQLKAGAK